MLFRRGGTAALGAAVVWSAPNIRTIAMRADAAGTPPPSPPQPGGNEVANTSADPAAVAPQTEGGSLPFTGTDPRPLLIAGGTAIAAGSAIIAVVKDPEPVRRRGLAVRQPRVYEQTGCREAVDELDDIAQDRIGIARLLLGDAAHDGAERAVTVAAQPHECCGRVQMVQRPRAPS